MAQAILAAKPIDESNLSHWKQGGYLVKETGAHSSNPWHRSGVRSPAPPRKACFHRNPNLIELN
jgi:hypothetical protein